MADPAGDHNGEEEAGGEAEQDKLLPIANVGRIMKQALPPNAKISKEAKETLQECASEFIAFVTGEASDLCRADRRKTLNGDDVCSALASLGFDHYALSLRGYLQRYRHLEEAKAVVAGEESRPQPQQPPDGSGEQVMGFGAGIGGGSSSTPQF